MDFFDEDVDYKEEYSSYLKSSHWQHIKDLYKKDRCELCGNKYQLQLHHRSYRRVGNEKETDLITLCDLCHKSTHEKVNNINLSTRQRARLIILIYITKDRDFAFNHLRERKWDKWFVTYFKALN